MKISYVILSWNSAQYISDCLTSIFEMKDIISQVIVVDNGSADDTRPILKRLRGQNLGPNSLHVVELDRNMGTTVSRNIGLSKIDSDADCVCILDSDTRVNQEAILFLANYLHSDSDIGIVGPRLIDAAGIVQPSGRNIPTITVKILKAVPLRVLQNIGQKMEQPASVSEAAPYPVQYLMSAFWMFRPSLLKEAGLLDEKIFYAPEDVEYCIRVHKAGKKILCCPNVETLHYWQRISKKKFFSRMNWEHVKGLLYLFYKHRFLFSTKRIIKDMEKSASAKTQAENTPQCL